MKFVCQPLTTDDPAGIEAAAQILLNAFDKMPFCETYEEAIKEVQTALQPGKFFLVARNQAREVIGWVGGQHMYSRVWELHPLAVSPAWQRQGVGTALVQALESCIASAGGLTIQLGTDDEYGGTNLYGQELYPDVLGAAQKLVSIDNHPFVFYQKLGFVVTGIVPDANGFGKPDIIMSRRVQLVVTQ